MGTSLPTLAMELAHTSKLAYPPTFLETGLYDKQTDGHRSWPADLVGNFPRILTHSLRALGSTTQVRLDSPQCTTLKTERRHIKEKLLLQGYTGDGDSMIPDRQAGRQPALSQPPPGPLSW